MYVGEKLGLMSVLLFVVSALVYVISMFITDLFSGPAMILLAIVIPIIGLTLAFRGKGGLKTVGIIGNSLVLLIAGIIPAVSTLFWNTP